MKATGIVRRIDDLGRVVIPKEIRRTMRIREGDPLEIYTDNDGEVIFKKYSPIGELSDFAGQFADVMARSCELPVLICDRDHCVAAAGISKKEVLERRISPHLEEIMESRRSVAVHKGDIGKVPPLEGLDIRMVVAIPIIAAGDVAGAVTLVTDGEAVANDTDFKMCQIASAFLGKQMEE